MGLSTQAVEAGRAPRRTPRILRFTPSSDWAEVLSQAVDAGFDTVLCHSDVPAGLCDVARAAGIDVLCDIAIDRVEGDAPEALFAALPRPTLDPRRDTELAPHRVAVVTGAASVAALAEFWAGQIADLAGEGFAGVRLLGLQGLPQDLLAPFLVALRQGVPDAVLFGWTPGLPWQALAGLPAGTLDWVASSLPWWDGRADWIWRELDVLQRVASVVADAGEDAAPGRRKLAAIMSQGWMTDQPDPAAHRLRNTTLSAGAHSRPIAPPGGTVVALQFTDHVDPRRAGRSSVAVVNVGGVSQNLVAPALLTRLGGDFGRFTDADGDRLSPATIVTLEPGAARVFTAPVVSPPIERPVTKAAVNQAFGMPRIAIENPTPCVDGGRFPARRTVGTLVAVECDIIADGHERFAAVVRYRGPGETSWTDVAMRPLVNDRWVAEIPLDRLGLTQYTIVAWKDVWAYYVYELAAKHKAGVNVALEIQEGRELIAKAAARSKKKLQAALTALLSGKDDDGTAREALLSPQAAELMAEADDRPHTIEIERPIPLQAERTAAGFASWYEVFPRSMSDDAQRHGTFRDVARQLPRIRGMGFDVLYFPPIHPIGRKNRKGRNNTLTPGPDDVGSPYAIGSEDGGHTAIHPDLGSLEDFEHLRMVAAEHGIELALDFAIQCSPDHPWLKQHPDWFNWRPDGSIRYAENPPKKYEDIVNVDFYTPGAMPGLWVALCDAVMFWARNGVRLFRVDNPHTKAFPFWEWMIAEVQARYPDTVFLAEAFTRPKVMYRLAKIGFSQSYTYFTWRHQRWEFQQYLTELTQGPAADFFRPHFFVNTPDINPTFLQTCGRPGFLIRAALAATLSGLWGVYNGFELCEGTPLAPGKEEYVDSEKYEIRAWDWERPGNIVAEITQLNALRTLNPALQTHLGITFLDCPNEQILVFEKATPDRGNVVLVAISLDPFNTQSGPISVPFWRYAPEPGVLSAVDLLGGAQEQWRDPTRTVTLPPDRPYALWRLSPTS